MNTPTGNQLSPDELQRARDYQKIFDKKHRSANLRVLIKAARNYTIKLLRIDKEDEANRWRRRMGYMRSLAL